MITQTKLKITFQICSKNNNWGNSWKQKQKQKQSKTNNFIQVLYIYKYILCSPAVTLYTSTKAWPHGCIINGKQRLQKNIPAAVANPNSHMDKDLCRIRWAFWCCQVMNRFWQGNQITNIKPNTPNSREFDHLCFGFRFASISIPKELDSLRLSRVRS